MTTPEAHASHSVYVKGCDLCRPPQRPAEPPDLASLDAGPFRLYGAALRRLTARALLRSTRALRALADTLTRLRWRLEDSTARDRAVAARHPSTRARLTAVPSLADNRFDLQFTHGPLPEGGWIDSPYVYGAGHGASEGDPDLRWPPTPPPSSSPTAP